MMISVIMKAHKMHSSYDDILSQPNFLYTHCRWRTCTIEHINLRVFWFVKNKTINHIFEKDKNSGKWHEYNCISMRCPVCILFIFRIQTEINVLRSHNMQNCKWAEIIFFSWVCLGLCDMGKKGRIEHCIINGCICVAYLVLFHNFFVFTWNFSINTISVYTSTK